MIMTEKPTYKELEQRIQKLEQLLITKRIFLTPANMNLIFFSIKPHW